MHKRRICLKISMVLVSVMTFCNISLYAEKQDPENFYKRPKLFSLRPSVKKSEQSIDRFGPVGIGIKLLQPAFVMKIKNVEKGSPADATGKLKPGQIIETINGEKLHDIDPRFQLGNIITDAEASDGIIKLVVKDSPAADPQEVIVKIPVLGKYSPTLPLNCPKSDRIVRNFADYLAKPDSNKGFSSIGMLFLLGTGEDKDIEPVRKWVHSLVGKKVPKYSWYLGYTGIPLCEYYLRTGDKVALPIIQEYADTAVKEEFMGGWSQKGHAANVRYGGGGGLHNAAGTCVVTFLMLAKECGAEIPDSTLLRVLGQYYRFAGRGNTPYGDNRPELGFIDNGKDGTLAFAMAGAASLTPEGEKSIYARARDICALASFYTTTYMLHGHTGGGIGELWRSAAMGLLYSKRPELYREFMNNRRWHYELSRRFDGSFGILGGARYDDISWGAGYALTYIIPRKTLRITGAPPTKFSKTYQLPKRPWGTKADDAFESIESAEMPDGTRPDFSNEKLAEGSGLQILERFSNPDIDDETLLRYAHHPFFFFRLIAARRIMGLDSHYLGKAKGEGRVRPKLAMQLLNSKDPRVRRAIIQAISERLNGEELMNFLGKDGFDKVIGILSNPEESWWVKDSALMLLAHCTADALIPHLDLIISFLKYDEWWLQNAALSALAPVATDERCYKKVIPAIGEMMTNCQRWSASGPVRYGTLSKNLRNATPEIQKFIAESLKKAFVGYTGKKKAEGGLDISSVYRSHMESIADTLAAMKGGYNILYRVARKRFPDDKLPYEKIFLSADFNELDPDLKKALIPTIRDHLVYEFIGKNRRKLLYTFNSSKQNAYVGNASAMDKLVEMYQKIGVNDYNWHPFGPDMKNSEWNYFTFDPKEKQAYDVSPWRYRKVTFPAGMKDWFKPSFDPVKAGWKKGIAPFGQYNGKLITDMDEMDKIKCKIDRPMRTFWDKEVLLINKKFEFPPLKKGHIYRFRVGSSTHVGCGSGYSIYINGKELIKQKRGVGRREGARPRGAFVTKPFFKEFGENPVTVAAITFLRYGDRAVVTMPPVPQGTFSLWMEEMKLPPMGIETLRKVAAIRPMRSSDWQSKQDPDDPEASPEDNKFVYDGKFVINEKLPGTWQTIAIVPTVGEFTPSSLKKINPNRAPFKELTFNDDGSTDSENFIWSGDTLMDLNRFEALKITPETIKGSDYIFIEGGGFSQKNPMGWKSQLVVMKRKK